jgi:hypothetical protein
VERPEPALGAAGAHTPRRKALVVGDPAPYRLRVGGSERDRLLGAVGLDREHDVEPGRRFRPRVAPQLAEVHPLDSGQHDRVAQHSLAASKRDPSFRAKRSGNLDYIGACPILALTSQGERAPTGSEDEGGDEHDREATASAHGGDCSHRRAAGRGPARQLRAGAPSLAV